MFSAIRQTVAGLDPNLPVYGTRTLERQVGQSLRRERLVATMTAMFGALATLLAVVGLYGVMSYTVARRTREIGVRVAFGARANDIRWLVIREVLVITAAGIAIGLPTAWWLGRYVSTQLYGVTPGDPAGDRWSRRAAGADRLCRGAGALRSRRATRSHRRAAPGMSYQLSAIQLSATSY